MVGAQYIAEWALTKSARAVLDEDAQTRECAEQTNQRWCMRLRGFGEILSRFCSICEQIGKPQLRREVNRLHGHRPGPQYAHQLH